MERAGSIPRTYTREMERQKCKNKMPEMREEISEECGKVCCGANEKTLN